MIDWFLQGRAKEREPIAAAAFQLGDVDRLVTLGEDLWALSSDEPRFAELCACSQASICLIQLATEETSVRKSPETYYLLAKGFAMAGRWMEAIEAIQHQHLDPVLLNQLGGGFAAS